MKHRELVAIEEVNDDLRTRLADALRESQASKDAYAKLHNGAHQQAVSDLETTRETLLQIEREFEITKSELKNTSSELSAFKDAFDRAEGLTEKLQSELAESRAQARAMETANESLQEENKNLREHFQESSSKFSSTSQELNSLRVADNEKVRWLFGSISQPEYQSNHGFSLCDFLN